MAGREFAEIGEKFDGVLGTVQPLEQAYLLRSLSRLDEWRTPEACKFRTTFDEPQEKPQRHADVDALVRHERLQGV